ncbi:NAD(P)H-dependent oxidoreductase [Glaciimonas sp. CA11.2]|uniref:NADPH-dependent FMN reductase n=1 Tax=unclassified Glaciimonas TaxID=2644401 RepID=UPI002AB44C84|nr:MULTISPECIES: NAD(P)H-dependent oxidoreductase [unclassified Glaciimonas]MDY7547745.1 NAD(P)H-dependent oxidoreductase [Glaciimonas sp. CA11.2]MEB0014410.1 NAD(P)H-dependent oxidoreductase [Glaciimonas sp. Cout2]MEB0082888.1 NAD(P)H-dependent oxidoreductase [Glaciimonas sp. Gout2]MEB0162689.1 NAD(P)H-dependent oxidoreductase [Glaciimonas sp. CA11.2]
MNAINSNLSREPLPNRPFIVGLGGTTRANSSTEKALRIALAAAEGYGAETVMLGAEDLILPMYAPDLVERTPNAQRLVALLRRADGIIIASPGYHGSMSGLVKNALDYTEDMRSDPKPYFEGRAVGCIVTAAGWQATTTSLMALRSVVHALRGWPTPLGVTINSAMPVFGPSGECLLENVAQQLDMVGRQVIDFSLRSMAITA